MNTIIGLGNCGTQVIKTLTKTASLNNDDIKLYAIDSVTASIDLDCIDKINIIPIVSDEKTGSGRNRERGRAMYEYHEKLGDFKTMYDDCTSAKSPVIVITSAAGGTGSGSTTSLCKYLIDHDIEVIPIIICPNLNDPDAYQLNANDLMIELSEIGIETYSIFRNPKGDADYDPINTEIASLIEIILGKKYDKTDLDSIDESDLDTILHTPGRFIAISASSTDVSLLAKEITRKAFTGYQPGWSIEESNKCTFMTAYSLTSLFAKQDFAKVFEDINKRISNVYDEYRNICVDQTNGDASATMIVAGLPRVDFKTIDTNFLEASGIADGMNKSHRPNFMSKKKASISTKPVSNNNDGGKPINQFNWK